MHRATPHNSSPRMLIRCICIKTHAGLWQPSRCALWRGIQDGQHALGAQKRRTSNPADTATSLVQQAGRTMRTRAFSLMLIDYELAYLVALAPVLQMRVLLTLQSPPSAVSQRPHFEVLDVCKRPPWCRLAHTTESLSHHKESFTNVRRSRAPHATRSTADHAAIAKRTCALSAYIPYVTACVISAHTSSARSLWHIACDTQAQQHDRMQLSQLIESGVSWSNACACRSHASDEAVHQSMLHSAARQASTSHLVHQAGSPYLRT